jgi:PAS domain S-box-containing protein
MKKTRTTASAALGSHTALTDVLDALTRHSFHAIMVSEASARTPIVYVNEAFTDLTGYAADETVGKSPGFLQGPATDRTVLDRLHQDMWAGRVFEGKAINYRKDGSAFTMHWRVVPVHDNGGRPLYFVAFQRELPSV